MATVHSHAFCNGEIISSRDIRLSPFQTGLLSGWGLFSTLRIYHGVPFALEDHLHRLATDGERLHVRIDHLLPGIADAFNHLIDRNKAFEAMARIYFIRNHGGLLDSPLQRDTDVLIFTAELRDWGRSASLCTQRHGRHAQAPLAGTKTLTWAHNLVLLETANQAGFDDVLLLNERDEVAECTSANIFIAVKDELLTPPLESGALAGISRKVILQNCARQGIRAAERTLRLTDVLHADEVFISSSTREVQPIRQIDEQIMPVGGEMSTKVERLFRQAVEEYVDARSATAR